MSSLHYIRSIKLCLTHQQSGSFAGYAIHIRPPRQVKPDSCIAASRSSVFCLWCFPRFPRFCHYQLFFLNVMLVTENYRGSSISLNNAHASSIDNIPNVGPQWATTFINSHRSISPEIRSLRNFSESSVNISMTLRKYILRGTRKSMVSRERSFVRPLISF